MQIKKFVIITIIVSILSCETVNGSRYQDLNEQLRAENSLMKNRLTLLQRENSILEDENFQKKKEIQQLNSKVEKLTSDLLSFKDKYQKDIALRETQYNNLEKKYSIMEKESLARIQDLTALNKNMETKLTLEIKQLNNTIKNLQDAFSKEREIMRNERMQKELAMSRQIEELKKSIDGKEGEIASQKTSLSELSLKLKEGEKSINEKEKAMLNLENENTYLKEKIKAQASDSTGAKSTDHK